MAKKAYQDALIRAMQDAGYTNDEILASLKPAPATTAVGQFHQNCEPLPFIPTRLSPEERKKAWEDQKADEARQAAEYGYF